MIKLFNQDCMEAIKEMPDKAYDLAIVDPPYGIGGDAMHQNRLRKGAGKLKNRDLSGYSIE